MNEKFQLKFQPAIIDEPGLALEEKAVALMVSEIGRASAKNSIDISAHPPADRARRVFYAEGYQLNPFGNGSL